MNQSLFSPIMEFEFPPDKPSEKLIEAQSALKEKGYAFSPAKKLCQVINGSIQEDSKFVFEVKKDDRAYNQKNYEEIGDIITEFVYGLLESSPMCLKRRDIPPASSGSKDTPRSFVYVSENFDSCDKLCVLIHGSGVVRAGQWVCIYSNYEKSLIGHCYITYLLFVITNLYPLEQARRLIMNEDLDVGTAIPEIMMALEQGYGVLVMNTNDNHR